MGKFRNPLNYMRWIPRLVDLLILIRSTRKVLPEISVPVLAVTCGNDELVSPQSATIFSRRLVNSQHKTVVLADSTHFHIPDRDRIVLYRELENFVIAASSDMD